MEKVFKEHFKSLKLKIRNFKIKRMEKGKLKRKKK